MREGNRRKGLRTGGSLFHGGRLQAHRRGRQGQLRPAMEHIALEVDSNELVLLLHTSSVRDIIAARQASLSDPIPLRGNTFVFRREPIII